MRLTVRLCARCGGEFQDLPEREHARLTELIKKSHFLNES
jgi:hypothetical protein